jgi:hypothetical protein
VVVAAIAAGCGPRGDRVTVREVFEPVQVPERIAGTTSRGRVLVQHDCRLAAVYEVREATGTAYLTQSQLLHLRLRPARAGTAYALECLGPLVVELPATATGLEAEAQSTAGDWRRSLSVRSGDAVPLSPAAPVRAAPGKQIVVVDWPRRPGAAYDNYRVELSFQVPKARFLRERVVYTAAVECAGRSYFAPVLPATNGLGWVNAYTIPPHGKPFTFIVPRLAAGISSQSQATRTLGCGA